MNRELDLSAQSVHEAIELQAKREGYRPKPVKAIIAPVLAAPHTPIYKMHRYYARRPHNVFAQLIQHYSNPGDLILDPFCGGGVTVVEALKLRRRVVGVDLNPLATWVTQVEVESVDFDRLVKLFEDWYTAVEGRVNQLFKAQCQKCHGWGVAEWFEWSNVVVCPACNTEVVLANAKKVGAGRFQCTTKRCKSTVEPSKSERHDDVMLSVTFRCPDCDISLTRKPLETDLTLSASIVRSERRLSTRERLPIPKEEFPDMDRARDDNIFGRGIKHFTDMMTPRQRVAMGFLKSRLPIQKDHDHEINAIYHIFSSTLRFTNRFVFRVPGWQGGKPIEWAGHNYWLPFHYLELNPIPVLRRRFRNLKSGKLEQLKTIGDFCLFPKSRRPWQELQDGATCWILTQSSHDMPLPDSSVDCIITDPPFGGNVQYGELSDFYLAWTKDLLGLKGLSDKTQEAIETRHSGFEGAKDRDFYENMLFKIFKECRRVIKPDGWMVMTFHNRDIGVWMSLHRAALRAGFRLPSESDSHNRGMVYQPPVQNYTQTIHSRAAGSMLGDFILSFRPVDPPIELDAIKSQLTLEEENGLRQKSEEIIRYHGGADDTTLMTGLIPYLHEKALLHRIAKYDLKILLQNGPFVFLPKEKKWFMQDMVGEGGALKATEMIPAEVFVQNLVHSFLSEQKQATMDELLVQIYTNLVNAHRPQISTIDRVVSRHCQKKRLKGVKRDLYVWNPKRLLPEQIQKILSDQLSLTLDLSVLPSHDGIIKRFAEEAIKRGFRAHVGETEQRKSPILAALSSDLAAWELGLPPKAIQVMKEIDLLILGQSTILAAVEVAMTFSTFNKAVNHRFRDLLAITPNLTLRLLVVLRDNDLAKGQEELHSVANVKSGLPTKIQLLPLSEVLKREDLGDLLRL